MPTDQPDRPRTMAEVPPALRPGLERLIAEARITRARKAQANHPPTETTSESP